MVLFKLLFIGYLYGIRSERQLVKEKVQEQCLLSAACQNMKKIVMHKARRAFSSLISWLKTLTQHYRPH